MIDREPNTNIERETTRRYLLANMLSVANAGRLPASHNRWSSFWQGLFKKTRML